MNDIRAQQTPLEQGLTTDQFSEIQNSLAVLQEQLAAQTPDHSVIQNTLKSLKTIFEGAAGAVVASGWLEMLQRLG